jgi:hypothetical protein
LRALDQRLLDATTEETESGETCSSSPEGDKVWWESSILGEGGKVYRMLHKEEKKRKENSSQESSPFIYIIPSSHQDTKQ